jgi:glutathione S-transferase
VKLYDAAGPNPRVVRMFLLEKGLEIPTSVMVLGIGDNKSPAHLARNPLGQVPVLETDSGACISETTAICEYLEELHPAPPLIGTSPEERGETRMWTRRADLMICEPLIHAFRFGPVGSRLSGRKFAADAGACAAMRALVRTNLAWFDSQLAGASFLCGERFSLADILAHCFLSYGIETGQALPPSLPSLAAWHEKIAGRPSASASLESRVDSMALSGTV